MSDRRPDTARGLRPFHMRSSPGTEIYHDDRTGDYWEAVGWITNPATILRNMRTGERHIEVIGCLNAERFAEVPQDKMWEVYSLD